MTALVRTQNERRLISGLLRTYGTHGIAAGYFDHPDSSHSPMQRPRQIAAIEKQRGSRVITTKETSGSKNVTLCAS